MPRDYENLNFVSNFLSQYILQGEDPSIITQNNSLDLALKRGLERCLEENPQAEKALEEIESSIYFLNALGGIRADGFRRGLDLCQAAGITHNDYHNRVKVTKIDRGPMWAEEQLKDNPSDEIFAEFVGYVAEELKQPTIKK